MTKVLLLEDDELFSLSLIDYLEEFANVNITHVNTSTKMLEMIYENRFDLYLLDINLPDINGIDLLREIRQATDETPVIFLTSYKDKETLTQGFSTGADDFLTKPFDMDELILRINSLMKRVKKQNLIVLGNVEFNFDTKEVKKDGELVKFSLKALELFELFYQNNHSIVTKDMIINRLWNASETYSDGSIRVYVNSIKKLFSDSELFHISNIKNIGYKIEY
ncbi:response regulator transcription factor [Arcobacter sp. 15-2]|uniref:response regulator transcription factor n=1 Tax=Arcobacter sp. 15-2 TaxID=3374109 RepID=UPI00399D4528